MKTTTIVILLLMGLAAGVFAINQQTSESEEVREDIPETVGESMRTNTATVEPSSEESSDADDDTVENDNETVVIQDLQGADSQGFPVVTNHYEIKEPRPGVYAVTLFAIINSPNQYQEYIDQLTQFKQEALSYMEDNGINTETASISFSPSEAEDL